MTNYHIAIVGGNPLRLRNLNSPPDTPTSRQYSFEVKDAALGVHVVCYVESYKRYLSPKDKQRLGESALRYIRRWLLCRV